jgi:hypothetical protein
MKNILKFALIALVALNLQSCESIPEGHKGVGVSWGGSTDMTQIYPEGLTVGASWMFDHMAVYDVREHTLVKSFQFNDKEDMLTTVVLALDYNLDPMQLNKLHTRINDISIKIETSLAAAAKQVVPQYSAVNLNKHSRAKAEMSLDSILKKELPEFFVEYKRVRITDVDFPKGISDLAAKTAVQLGKNELASKLEQQKIFEANAIKAEAQGIADAKVITSIGNLKSAVNDSKTKDLLSSPKMIALQRVENDRIIAEGFRVHGKSIYGTGNIFGSGAATIVKGLSIGGN